jgi:MFS family permease
MTTPRSGHRFVRTRLSVMMFLFYFGMGAWVVTLSTYLMSAPIRGGLNFTTGEVGLIYSAFAVGGMIAPMTIGLLTDRLFRAERVLGVTNLLSAGLLLVAGTICDDTFPLMDAAYRESAAKQIVDGRPALDQLARHHDPHDATDDAFRDRVRAALDQVNDDPAVRRIAADAFNALLPVMLGYCIAMQLALTLTTVIGLRNVPDPAHDFSRVRLFGTVGWIASGFVMEAFFRPATSDVFYVAAGGAALTGLFAFTLPATRPLGTGRSAFEALGLPALKLFADPSFVVFVLVAFVTTAMNQFYVVYAHRYITDHNIGRASLVMTIAQFVEVACMYALPFLRPKDWMKPLMIFGLAGYTLRCAVLAIGWTPAIIALGVPMHGWGFTFFFLVASTYLDREAPPHLRGSAQGIITFISGGIGVLAGNTFSAIIVDRYRQGTIIDWTSVWEVPLAVCSVMMLAFVLLFRTPAQRN